MGTNLRLPHLMILWEIYKATLTLVGEPLDDMSYSKLGYRLSELNKDLQMRNHLSFKIDCVTNNTIKIHLDYLAEYFLIRDLKLVLHPIVFNLLKRLYYPDIEVGTRWYDKDYESIVMVKDINVIDERVITEIPLPYYSNGTPVKIWQDRMIRIS